ncbi:uncharacterized protein J3R85_005591 [Psidium guajava]|nr:uncharacterized protein J3R85_005591 [Psidium guajava]
MWSWSPTQQQHRASDTGRKQVARPESLQLSDQNVITDMCALDSKAILRWDRAAPL